MAEPAGCKFITAHLMKCSFNALKILKESWATIQTRILSIENDDMKEIEYNVNTWPALKELHQHGHILTCQDGVCSKTKLSTTSSKPFSSKQFIPTDYVNPRNWITSTEHYLNTTLTPKVINDENIDDEHVAWYKIIIVVMVGVGIILLTIFFYLKKDSLCKKKRTMKNIAVPRGDADYFEVNTDIVPHGGVDYFEVNIDTETIPKRIITPIRRLPPPHVPPPPPPPPFIEHGYETPVRSASPEQSSPEPAPPTSSTPARPNPPALISTPSPIIIHETPENDGKKEKKNTPELYAIEAEIIPETVEIIPETDMQNPLESVNHNNEILETVKIIPETVMQNPLESVSHNNDTTESITLSMVSTESESDV